MTTELHRFLKVVTAVALAVFAGMSPAAGREPEFVKAAFVYRLSQFVVWPESGEVFVIGVLGRTSSLEPLKDVVANKLIQGRPIEVRHFSQLSQLEEVDLLLVAPGYRRWTDRILRRYAGKPTLTVGEYGDFALRGGMVALSFRDDRLSLELNHRAATEGGLRISPKLLAVADKVVDHP